MKVILDTNVFVAGVFFAGPPYAILNAWRRGRLQLVVSAAILEEYRRVGDQLGQEFPAVDAQPSFDLLAVHAQVIEAPPLPAQVCSDPDDDKFLSCAVASNTGASGTLLAIGCIALC